MISNLPQEPINHIIARKEPSDQFTLRIPIIPSLVWNDNMKDADPIGPAIMILHYRRVAVVNRTSIYILEGIQPG